MRIGEEVDLALEREAAPPAWRTSRWDSWAGDIALEGPRRNGGTPPCSFTYGSCCQNKRKRRSSEVTLVRCHQEGLGTGGGRGVGSPLPRHVPAVIGLSGTLQKKGDIPPARLFREGPLLLPTRPPLSLFHLFGIG